MAITINNAGSYIQLTNAQKTVSYTVSAGNKNVLFLFGDVASATYNGVALTSNTNGFYLANPTVGTANLVINHNVNGNGYAGAYFVATDVDQTTPFGVVSTDYSLTGGSSSGYSSGASFVKLRTEPIYGMMAIRYQSQTVGTIDLSHVNSANFLTGSGVNGVSITEARFAYIPGFASIPNSAINLVTDQYFNSATEFKYGVSYSNIYSAGQLASVVFFFINEAKPSATATTGSASTITFKSANLSSTVNGNGYSNNVYFEYGTTLSYGATTTTQNTGTTSTTTTLATGALSPSTLYNYRVVSDNGNGITYGSNATFTTLPTPTITTTATSSVTTNSATFNASLLNGNVPSDVSFDYGTATGVYPFTTPVNTVAAGSVAQVTGVNATSLIQGTTYYYRAKMLIDGVFYYGTELTVIPGSAPVLVLNSVTNLLNVSMTLNGSVNPGGLATNYNFSYGVTPALGTNTTVTAAGSGTSPVIVTANISGLIQNTTYYYKLTATNGSGTNNTSTASQTTVGVPVITSLSPRDPVSYTTNSILYVASINAATATYTFNYGLISNTYTLSVAGTINTNTGAISLSNLLPNKTYYGKLTITNTYGSTLSNEVSFTTFNTNYTTEWTNLDTKPTTNWINQ